MIKESFINLFEKIIANYTRFFPDSDLQVLYRAYNLAHICHKGQFRKDRNPYFFHPLSVAIILSEWGLDNTTIAAALLHDTVEDVDDSSREELRETIRDDFGDEIYNLVEGVTKKEKLPEITKDERKEVSLKKMFLHSSRDIRVILVKIADRMHNLRTLGNMPKRKQIEISLETLSVYIPLTKVLGLYFAAREMEDLCLYYLNRDIYRQLDALVDRHVGNIESQYRDFKITLSKALKKSGTKILRLEKRNKNLFSVLKKYLRKDKAEDIEYDSIVLDELILSEIVRELNVVITVESKIEIGKVLGILTNHFQNMPNPMFPFWENEMFDHFIQIGDTYGTVNIGFRCEEENALRLRSIQEKADFSINIKKKKKDILGSFLSFSKILKEVQTIRPTKEFYKIFEDIVSSPQILVFIGENQSLIIPMNSTVLDLFVLMNDLGINDQIPEMTAYVNGREVELSSRLSNNDKADIKALESELVIRKDWIDEVELSITRDILVHQFNRQDYMQLVSKGREKLATKLKLNRINDDVLFNEGFWELAEEKLGLNDSDQTYKKLLDDPYMLDRLIDTAHEFNVAAENESLSLIPRKIKNIFKLFDKQSINLEDIEEGQLTFCIKCKPLPGEYITGVWESNLLNVHRLDKEGIKHIAEPNECIPLKWGSYKKNVDVPAVIIAENRIGNLEKLLKSLERLEDILLLSVSHADEGETSTITLLFRLSSIYQYNILAKLFKKTEFIQSFKLRDID